MFQSTRPRGARQFYLFFIDNFLGFQSTRPRGARLLHHFYKTPRDCFNPRAHVGRDIIHLKGFTFDGKFQSTRPRGARLFLGRGSGHHLAVSIHAPAWGATAALQVPCCRWQVSIHAPAWGATDKLVPLVCDMLTFQSTRPRGARPYPIISLIYDRKGFNPRARVGRDRLSGTRPRRSQFGFNPRARVGRD